MSKIRDGVDVARLPGFWLAMDTSTTAMTIALFKDGDVIGESLSRSERNHSIRLVPAVQELLSDHGLKASELDGVVVGHGPGSYTGIRIAVTVAKTLAWQLKVPLIGVSSLEALAYGAALRAGDRRNGYGEDGPLWIVPFMDARRGKVYTGLYEWHKGGWRVVEEDGIRPMDSWLMTVADRAENDTPASVTRVILAGDGEGFASVLKQARERRGTIIPLLQEVDQEPLQAVHVGWLAMRCGLAGACADTYSFEPNYTQLSEPEKKLQLKNQG